MHDDEAFLAKIAESPDDETARLVYADWLDEQGDEVSKMKAGLMRAVTAYTGAYKTIKHAMPLLSALDGGPLWMGRAMGGFSVTITAFRDKIQTIKAVRTATGYGLGQAKWAVEHLPQKVWCTRNEIGPEDFALALTMPEGYVSGYRPATDEKERYRPLTWVEAENLGKELQRIGATYVVEPFVVPRNPPALPPKPGEPGYY